MYVKGEMLMTARVEKHLVFSITFIIGVLILMAQM